MPDASITDANRNAMFDRLGILGGMYHDWLQLKLLYHPKNFDHCLVQLVHGDEDRAAIGEIRITRCVIGTDTDLYGVVYGTLTDGGAGTGHTCSFYMDQARGSKIADLDAAVNDGGTGLISPDSASYYLDGEIDLVAVSGNEAFAFHVMVPMAQRLLDEFDGDHEEDSAVRSAIERSLETIYSRIDSTLSLIRSHAQLLVLGTATSGGLFKRIIGFADDTVLLTPGLSKNSSGGIVSAPTGMLETLRLAMAGNTGGSGEIKCISGTLTPTVAFPDWTGINSGCTLDDRAVAGVWYGTCVKTLDSTSPRFRLTFVPTDSRKDMGAGYSETQAEFELTIGQTFRSYRGGIASFTLDYSGSVTTDGTFLDTTAANWNVSGMTTANSTSGRIWLYLTAGSVDIEVYATEAGRDAQDADDLVASCTYPGAATAFSATGDAGITVNGKTGAAPAATNTGDVDFDPPVAVSPADFFTVTVAETAPSKWQRIVYRGLIGGQSWRLNSGAVAAGVVDTQITAGFLMGGRTVGNEP